MDMLTIVENLNSLRFNRKKHKPFDKYIENHPGCISMGNPRWVVPTAQIPVYCAKFLLCFGLKLGS